MALLRRVKRGARGVIGQAYPRGWGASDIALTCSIAGGIGQWPPSAKRFAELPRRLTVAISAPCRCCPPPWSVPIAVTKSAVSVPEVPPQNEFERLPCRLSWLPEAGHRVSTKRSPRVGWAASGGERAFHDMGR